MHCYIAGGKAALAEALKSELQISSGQAGTETDAPAQHDPISANISNSSNATSTERRTAGNTSGSLTQAAVGRTLEGSDVQITAG